MLIDDMMVSLVVVVGVVDGCLWVLWYSWLVVG